MTEKEMREIRKDAFGRAEKVILRMQKKHKFGEKTPNAQHKFMSEILEGFVEAYCLHEPRKTEPRD